jgi:Flp pilus assembly protein TadG
MLSTRRSPQQIAGPDAAPPSHAGRLRRFIGDARGATAMVFAFAVMPMMIAIGAGVDLARLTQKRSDLQQATDFTALALAKDITNNGGTATATVASKYLLATNRDSAASIVSGYPTTNTQTGEICVQARTTVPTVVMSIVGIQTMPTSATACANVALGNYEVALVLDNTGSMANQASGGTKIAALQAAARQFVNFMFNSPSLGPRTKMSLVPFATSVRLDTTYATEPFMDRFGASSWAWKSPAFQANAAVAASRFDLFNLLKAARPSYAWAGCVEALPYPKNVTDTTPQASDPDSLIEPMLAPDEPDGNYTESYLDSRGRPRTRSVGDPWVYSNTYLDDNGQCSAPNPAGSTAADELVKQSRLCKYKNPTINSASTDFGPNALCTTQALMRLSTSSSALLNKIDAMSPNGWTNIHEGFMWGWRTVSPVGPFADGKPYSDTTTYKVIVLMTDGMNTWSASANEGSKLANQINKSDYSALGYYTNANGRLPPANQNVTTDTQARAAMDALTLEACSNARAQGITIYTVGFSGTYDPIDQQGQNMLTACAGSAERAFFTNSSAGLQTAFTQIGNQISKLRLSK